MSPPITQASFLPLPTGEKIFYRHASPPNIPTEEAPTILLLLHGFPTSSFQYRALIPLLSHKYRVIAPDLPGFGFTTVPETYTHTFSNLAKSISTFLTALPNPPKTYAIYVFDDGAPVGFRLATANPAAITAIVSQNGNAYTQGLTSAWAPIQKHWASGTAADRESVRPLLTPETTQWQYTHGTQDPECIDPATWTLDSALLARSGNDEVQLDLFYDYRTNEAEYPVWQAYLRESRVPVLAVWGKHDPFFGPAGAEAFRKDVEGAEVHLLDAGHFVAETETAEVAALMLDFLGRKGV